MSKHWTERSVDNYCYRLVADLLLQIGEGSQLHTHPPRSVTLGKVVRAVKASGLKLALVAYDDGDRSGLNGPVNSQIFERCWQQRGRPTDFFELGEAKEKPCTKTE